jgi:hypothetical protein
MTGAVIYVWSQSFRVLSGHCPMCQCLAQMVNAGVNVHSPGNLTQQTPRQCLLAESGLSPISKEYCLEDYQGSNVSGFTSLWCCRMSRIYQGVVL